MSVTSTPDAAGVDGSPNISDAGADSGCAFYFRDEFERGDVKGGWDRYDPGTLGSLTLDRAMGSSNSLHLTNFDQTRGRTCLDKMIGNLSRFEVSFRMLSSVSNRAISINSLEHDSAAIYFQAEGNGLVLRTEVYDNSAFPSDGMSDPLGIASADNQWHAYRLIVDIGATTHVRIDVDGAPKLDQTQRVTLAPGPFYFRAGGAHGELGPRSDVWIDDVEICAR